jgi:hypothetical protein
MIRNDFISIIIIIYMLKQQQEKDLHVVIILSTEIIFHEAWSVCDVMPTGAVLAANWQAHLSATTTAVLASPQLSRINYPAWDNNGIKGFYVDIYVSHLSGTGTPQFVSILLLRDGRILTQPEVRTSFLTESIYMTVCVMEGYSLAIAPVVMASSQPQPQWRIASTNTFSLCNEDYYGRTLRQNYNSNSNNNNNNNKKITITIIITILIITTTIIIIIIIIIILLLLLLFFLLLLLLL